MINHVVCHVYKPQEKKHAVRLYEYGSTHETIDRAHKIRSHSLRRHFDRLTMQKPTHKAQLNFGTTNQLLNITLPREELTKKVNLFKKVLTARHEFNLCLQGTIATDLSMHCWPH